MVHSLRLRCWNGLVQQIADSTRGEAVFRLINHLNEAQAAICSLDEHFSTRAIPKSCKEIHIDNNRKFSSNGFTCVHSYQGNIVVAALHLISSLLILVASTGLIISFYRVFIEFSGLKV